MIAAIQEKAPAAAPEKKRFSLDEYLARERRSDSKLEFHNGKIIEMPGASPAHNRIALNISSALDPLIKKNNLELFVLNSDTQIRIDAFNRNVYPDAVVLCEKPRIWERNRNTILNPLLIFEVLSESTEDFDRKDKFIFYRSLPSFREYVLLDQFCPSADSYFKQNEAEDLWKITSVRSMEAVLPLRSIGLEVPLSAFYWKVPELQGERWSVD